MRPLDSFNDFNFPAMACGDFMYGGMAVVISPNVPREHVGDELIPVPHFILYRAVYWLMTGNSAPPKRFRPGARIEREQYFRSAGKLFMTEQGWTELKASAKLKEPAPIGAPVLLNRAGIPR